MNRLITLSWVVLAMGCAGPRYDFEDLPDVPIALVYRNMTEAEQASDAFYKMQEKLRTARTGIRSRMPKNTLNFDDVAQTFGVYGSSEQRAASMLGRMALLDPRTGTIETVDWAPRGSRPLAWSADHQRLLYLSLRRGMPHIYERDFRTGDITPITHTRRRHLDACYCGEDAIVFSAFLPSGGTRLYRRQAGSGKAQPITDGPIDFAPTCAPDGSTVYWASRQQEGFETISSRDLTDPDAEVRVLTRGRHPSATPDGEWLLYSAKTRGGWKVWRMRTDGTGRHPLGRGADWEHQPTASTEGGYVVFVTTPDEKEVHFSVWVRPLDGDLDRPLSIDGEGLHPVW
ncbi:MAG: hypothetical protein GY723_21020 [bacterium]|nr:hypothetical protein [bacterium]MCP5067616.1 hypothetical protein [bacterium]